MAGEESGAPAPYSYVSRTVRIQHTGGEMRDVRGVLVDVSALGAELLVGGRRHFLPWTGVARMSLVEDDGEPGGRPS